MDSRTCLTSRKEELLEEIEWNLEELMEVERSLQELDEAEDTRALRQHIRECQRFLDSREDIDGLKRSWENFNEIQSRSR